MRNQAYAAMLEQVNLVVAIDHARAGNGFFTTLLDQHPQLLACPAIHYLYSYIVTQFGDRERFSRDEAMRFATTQSYFKYIYGEADEETQVYFRKMGIAAESDLDRSTAKTVFDSLFDGPTVTRKELVVGIYYAYARAIGRDVSQVTHIFVSDCISLKSESISQPFSARILDLILHDFSDARLIHLVRDPRASFASFKQQYVNQNGNMYGVRWGNSLQQLALLCRNRFRTGGKVGGGGCVFLFTFVYFTSGFQTLARVKRRLARHFLTVKNEDLNTTPVQTLGHLCSWLGVRPYPGWAAEDFTPTVFGVVWKGVGAYNNNYQTQQSGPLGNDSPEVSLASAKPNSYVTMRWRSRLSATEIRLIESVLYPEIACHQYEPLYVATPRARSAALLKSLCLPFRGEVPKLSWLLSGFKLGKREAWDRLYFYLTLPAFFVLSRLVLLTIYVRGFFDTKSPA